MAKKGKNDGPIEVSFESAEMRKTKEGRVVMLKLEIGLDLATCKRLPTPIFEDFSVMRDPMNAADQIKLSSRWGSLVAAFRATPTSKQDLHLSDVIAQDLMLKKVKTAVLLKLTLVAPLVPGTVTWASKNFKSTVFMDLDTQQLELLPVDDEDDKPEKKEEKKPDEQKKLELVH